MLVIDPKHGAAEQEEQEHGQDDDGAEIKRLLAFCFRFTGQHALDDQLVRSMGRHHLHRGPDDTHPDAIRQA